MLDDCEEFVSAQELHQLIRQAGESVSLATVYRILQSHQQDGRVDVVRNAEGEALYRNCVDTGHHHHLVCRQCGAAEELHAPSIERWADQVAQEHNFTQVEHNIEIFGLCPKCSAENNG